MAKVERRSIRIAGKTINSPRFTGKDARRHADEWYSKKATEKDFIEGGLMTSDSPTFFRYSQRWFATRMQKYPRSTWAADETRLRKYLLPALSELPMNRITRTQMRDVIQKACAEHRLSSETRTRIKSLASKIFNDAMNENPPHVHFNPCAKMTFSEGRKGKKKPITLGDGDEVRAFLECAASFGRAQEIACALAVMAGLRKSELIPLQYKNVHPAKILVEHHVEQASLKVVRGTKAGTDESREVAIPHTLYQMIERHRSQAVFKADNDFILADEDGDWIRPRVLHDMIDEVVKAFGKPVTLHKLRHSYGRIFMTRTGNQQALKDQLGHKSLTTTVLYSELSGQQRQPFGEMMNFEAVKVTGNVSGVPPKRHLKNKKVRGI